MYKSGEYLKTIRRTDLLIKRKKEQLERLESLAVYSSPQNDPIGGGHGTKVVMDSKAEIVVRIIETKEEIEQLKDSLIDIKLKAMKMMESITNDEAVRVLYMRYFDYMKWEQIAEERHCSLDSVFRLHRCGLRVLERFF